MTHPPSVREKALSTFWGLFENAPEFRLTARMPSWLLSPKELPALMQIDGGATPRSGQLQGQMLYELEVAMVIVHTAASEEQLGSEISHLEAQVLKKVGDAMFVDPTLGGVIQYAEYIGTDMALIVNESGAPPTAQLVVNYALLVEQHEFDPYRTV